MDPGNKDSKTAVEFSCKLTKKREIGLRLKELVKMLDDAMLDFRDPGVQCEK